MQSSQPLHLLQRHLLLPAIELNLVHHWLQGASVPAAFAAILVALFAAFSAALASAFACFLSAFLCAIRFCFITQRSGVIDGHDPLLHAIF